MTLQDAFSDLKDPRRAQGQRTSLSQMLTMIVISNLCGHFGGRPISRFAKIYSEDFTNLLLLKHPIPSHVSFTTLINSLDEQELICVFNKWTASYMPLDNKEALSGDGKALGSTVTSAHSKSQDFQAVVSLFCQKSGLVRSLESYRNAKKSEVNVIRFLVKELEGMGVTIVLDALHAKKNG
jgi:hypothetical protein